MIPGLTSIVICAYNNWPDVELTMQSALQQSYGSLEVIVIDNSSTDATPETVPSCFGRDVRYVCQPNRGDSGAYNTGFDLAAGEFIQFVDGDDVLAPNKIEKQIEVFHAHPDTDVVYGDIRAFQTLPGRAVWEDPATRPEVDMLWSLLSRGGAGISALGSLFHRRAVERVGRWDESLYCSDTDYWLRAAWAGCQFAHCALSPAGFSRIRPGQMSQDTRRMREGLEAVWEKALGYITTEPHRTLILGKLAQLRFFRAVSSGHSTRRDALAELRLARHTAVNAISAAAYAVAAATIVVPGGSALVRSPLLRSVRGFLARLFGYGVSR